MSDFIAHIVGELDLSAARSQMDSFLSEYENKKIEITPQINSSGLDKALSGNSGQYQKAGQNIGKQISQGVNSGVKLSDGLKAFSEGQQKQRKEISKNAEELQKAYSIESKDAYSDAQKYQRKEIKETNQQLKEQQKLQEQNIAQTRRNQKNMDSIAIQQKMAQYQQRATEKNSHYNSLVDSGKEYYQQLKEQREIRENLSKYLDSGKADATLSKMGKQLDVYAGQSTPNIEKATQAMKDYSSALDSLKAHDSGEKILDKNSISETTQKLKKSAEVYKNTMSQIRDETSKTLAPGVATQGANKILSYLTENTKAAKKYGSTLQELAQQYKQVTTVEEKSQLDSAFKNLQSRISAEGLTGKSGIDEFKRAFKQIGQFAGMYAAIQNVIMEVPSKVISSVKDVDSAMTNLYKVTDESQSRYSKYLNTASNNAPKLGRSMSSYISQTSEWSKLGYSLDDSEQLSKLSSMYANVGEVSDDTAVSDMVTAMKAFNIQASDAESIIDQLNILGNNFATSSADLGEGLSNSASSLATAGNDLGHSLAMLTGMSEITQSAPEAGNALKILAMRVRGYDEETDSYTNDTEELSGAIADLTKTAKTPGGISLFTDDTKQTYKDTYTLMEEISEIYDDLTDKNRAELLEKLAGKNRGNQIAALIQGFQSGQVQKAYQDTLNSDGSAQQEQDRWLESIEAKQQQFEAAFQKMATTTFSSDMFKGLIDGGTNLLNLFTNLTSSIGMLNTAAIGLGIFQGKTGSGKSTWEFAPCIFQMTYAA